MQSWNIVEWAWPTVGIGPIGTCIVGVVIACTTIVIIAIVCAELKTLMRFTQFKVESIVYLGEYT